MNRRKVKRSATFRDPAGNCRKGSRSAGADGGSGSGPFSNVLSPNGTTHSVLSESLPLSARIAQPVPSVTCRRSVLSIVKRPTPLSESSVTATAAVLHCLPTQNPRGGYLQFQSFDETYLDHLRSGDFRTQEHFCAYFGALIKIKLGSRVNSQEIIDDLRQETFARFFVALRQGKILQPERLCALVNSICNNVLMEHYRSAARSTSLDEDDETNVPASDFDLLGALGAKETEKKVREILEKLPERDRRLLREIFFEERDKDDVCRDFG